MPGLASCFLQNPEAETLFMGAHEVDEDVARHERRREAKLWHFSPSKRHQNTVSQNFLAFAHDSKELIHQRTA